MMSGPDGPFLVTGGAGFIGSHIVRRLAARGAQVRVLDNFETGRRENLAGVSGVDVVEGDLRSAADCARAVRGIRLVLHQGALPSVPRSIEDPTSSHEVNATGTLNLLRAAVAAKVERVVYASSSSVYGPEPTLPRRECQRPHPISPYAVSKLAGEHYCRAFFESYGLATVALRYFNVFGPGQRSDSAYAAVIPRFVSALARGERPVIFGDGRQTRDFTYVDDVVDANLLALSSPGAPGNVYNVAAGRGISVNELFALVAGVMNSSLTPSYAAPRTGDVRDSIADASAAERDLGFRPKVSVEEGIRRTVNAS